MKDKLREMGYMDDEIREELSEVSPTLEETGRESNVVNHVDEAYVEEST